MTFWVGLLNWAMKLNILHSCISISFWIAVYLYKLRSSLGLWTSGIFKLCSIQNEDHCFFNTPWHDSSWLENSNQSLFLKKQNKWSCWFGVKYVFLSLCNLVFSISMCTSVTSWSSAYCNCFPVTECRIAVYLYLIGCQ